MPGQGAAGLHVARDPEQPDSHTDRQDTARAACDLDPRQRAPIVDAGLDSGRARQRLVRLAR